MVRDEARGKINAIAVELLLGGALDEAQRQRLLEVASRCPVHRTLMEGVRITHR